MRTKLFLAISLGIAMLVSFTLFACGDNSIVPVAELSAGQLLKAYEDNEVAADDKYKGKWIKVHGPVESIGKDILDQPYVALKTGQYELISIQIYFKDNSQLGNIKKDQNITIVGRCNGMLGNILIEDAFFDKEKKESAKDAAVEQPQAIAPASPVPPSTGTVTDSRNGKTYKTVVIGKQTWMAENLAVEYGSAFCEPDDDYCIGEKGSGEVEDNGKYGKLYTPYLAQTACPSGWHLPSQAEWNELIAFAGGENAATALKGKSGWKTNGTDAFGFNALPGGFKRNKIGDGDFSPVATKDVGVAGNWWSSTEAGSGKYYDFHIDDKSGVRTDKDGCTNDNGWKNCYLLSVRCVKNN